MHKECKDKNKAKSLNLKYGPNGTGKSTISKAIFAKANNKEIELNKLKSYYKLEMPYVRCDNCNSVRVFNEDYVNSYLFTEKSFLGNSFQVFLQSEDFDKLSKKTTLLLEELQSIFEKSESINGLKEFLPTYFTTMKFKDGSLSQRGGVGELIKGYGYGFENHSELKDFSPYFHDRDFSSVSKWAKWRNDGTKQIYGELCPFCTHLLDKAKIKKQNEIIAKVFKSSALTNANALLDFLDHGVEKGYINIASVKVLKKYFGDDNKSDELLAELNQLGNETDYLCIKIQKICSFRPMNISSDKLNEIESILDDMCIDGRQISKYYSTKVVNELVDYISEKIIDLRQKTGLLKGLFIQCQKKWIT